MPFTLSNFLGDPFAISTVSFGVISWVVTVAGAAADASHVPHFTWWGLVYQILMILVIFGLYLNNNIELYKFTLVGLLSVGFVYLTNSINSLIYNSGLSGNLCCAAGCILSSILNLIWILYFGGHPESPTNQFIDSFSIKSQSHNHGHLSSANDNQKLHEMDEEEEHEYKPYGTEIPPLGTFQDSNLRQSQITTGNKKNTPYMSSSQLNGLENFSSADVHQGRDLTTGAQPKTVFNEPQNLGASAGTIPFRYKARALYSYDANPDDINEISFVKDELLEVDDIDGKWWQARRANGQVGICPSNYVKLLD
ncbi:high osmolarity signaling protein SHO1 [Suhomyces tanzawaensis NRRL Y-17324]|uniref:High osmolarity signaling protein SHO1 n=1 Tax=Suhomyces tanzawaensis NRRL Y-17324 TaxID=984487 RepID=A0A1E4SBI6_9ASCO|nr:high osmolarity signaling protein SHO1 [Suhomyces tanzawaensis NRRL Y-17324]ODV76859.1 high osmolarity signaling protein SHO1 [Suhomyces tanzawaensis NRRL Y-17324]